MEQILTYTGYFLMFIGALFLLLGSLGILRMPDIYSRLQAGTKASTLGSIGMLLGIGLIQPNWFVKILVIIVFVLLSNPISSHSIARGSYKSGIKPKLNEDNALQGALDSEVKTKNQEQ